MQQIDQIALVGDGKPPLRKLCSQMTEAAGPQLVPLDSPVISDDMLQIQYRGAELKLPAGVDIDAVATLLRSLQTL